MISWSSTAGSSPCQFAAIISSPVQGGGTVGGGAGRDAAAWSRLDFVPVGHRRERVSVLQQENTAWPSVRRLCLILRVVQWLGLVVFGWVSVWLRR